MLGAVVLFPGGGSATDCAAPASEFVDLSSDGGPDVVVRTVAVFEDADGSASYDSVLRADREGKFRWHCRADLEPGTSGSALWIRLNLRLGDSAPSDWVFTFGSAQIDEARLYHPQPGGLFILKRTGRAVPRGTRDMVSRWPAIGLSLQNNATTPIFVRLSGVTAPYMSLELVPKHRYADREAVDLLTIAAVLGFMIAMLAYNIVIYIRSRLHQCLYYFLYISFIILHVVIYDGFILRFSDVRLTGYLHDGLAQFMALAAAICILMFGRELLRLRSLAPWMDRLVLVSAWLIGISFAVELTGLLPLAIASSITPLIAGLVMCGCAIRFALQGSRPAIYFSLSFVALLAGAALDTLGYFYPVALVAEPSLWSALIGVQQNWSFHIGICAEALLISFAITYFIRDIQVEVRDVRAEADRTRQETIVARREFKEKYSDLAQRVGIRAAAVDAAAKVSSANDGFRDHVTDMVRQNLADETFDVAKLAGSLAMSERTLRRRIREVADMSPVEFMRRQRLERAREYLENGSYQTVAQVARAVGIASPGYFSRVYREAFGQSPRDALKGN